MDVKEYVNSCANLVMYVRIIFFSFKNRVKMLALVTKTFG